MERCNVNLLEVKDFSRRFGGLIAVNDVSFSVEKGIIFGIIGPNGAGKTTLYNLITGVIKPDSGYAKFDNEDITGLSTHKIAAKGLVRTFQHTTLFYDFTAFENLSIAHHLGRSSGLFPQLLNSKVFRIEEKKINSKCEELLYLLGLYEVRNEKVKSLPHGYQRALGIALALSAYPKMLLLDEPVTGLNEVETARMMQQIRRLKDELNITIILIEHVMQAMMGLSEHIIVLNTGQKIAEGKPEEIVKNPLVIDAYLGKENSY